MATGYARLFAALHLLLAQPYGAATGAAPPDPHDADTRTERDATQLRVVALRARWQRALDAAEWDRDDPRARAEADEITADLLPLLGAEGDVRAEALGVVLELGGEPLGAYLRGQSTLDPQLTIAYLRHNDDPALAARVDALPPSLQSAPMALRRFALGLGYQVWTALALAHRAVAAAPIQTAFSSRSVTLSYEADRLCGAALALPDAAREAVAGALVAQWTGDPPDDVSVSCATLGAQTHAGRTRLASWLGRRSHTETPAAWPIVAALVAPPARRAAAEAAVDDVIASASRYHLDWRLRSMVEAVARVIPALPPPTPLTRALLARLARAGGGGGLGPLAAVRLRLRDGSLLAEAIATARSGVLSEEPTLEALGIVGLLSGNSGAARAQGASSREFLTSIRDRGGNTGELRAAPRRAAAEWLGALDAVSACHGARGCLAGLLADGTDAAAARAVFALGAQGLASLTSAEARPLVRRLALQPDAWLLASFVFTVAGCPPALRGAREALYRGSAEIGAGTAAYFAQFERACARAP